jgi:hypothetical protein
MATDSDFISRIATQLKIGKSPASRRSIDRIMGMVRVKYECGLYGSQSEAETDLRKQIEEACSDSVN